MARHFLELDGAKTMRTPQFALIGRCIDEATQEQAIAVVHGDAGLGKTFAVEHASVRVGVESHWLTFPREPAITNIVKALLEAITKVPHRGERFKLTNDLRVLLAEKPRLIVVDEAQQLNARALDYLRYLHDDPATSFALIFVGGNGCWRTLSRYPMLLSRVYRRVAMTPLTEAELVNVLPRYHEIYRSTPVDLLLLVDEQFARGNFRRWAAFTKTVTQLCAEHGRDSFDEPLARAALALLPNWTRDAA